MTNLSTIEYFRARETREREMANAASNPAVAAIHLEMAKRYSEMIVERSVPASHLRSVPDASSGRSF